MRTTSMSLHALIGLFLISCATIAVAEISRICTAVQTAATRLATDDRKIHTGPVNVHSIKAGIGRLADRRQKLTITALAEELGVTRQNLNRSIRKDRELLTAYTASVEKAQQETGVARRTQKK